VPTAQLRRIFEFFLQILSRQGHSDGERKLSGLWSHSAPRSCGDSAMVGVQRASHHYEQVDFPGW
jgi:hypothetical protein